MHRKKANCMQKHKRIKILAGTLIIGMLLPVLPVQALEENTPKEEVVYANLNGDGTVEGIYVVNSFVLNERGQIVDYGDYESLRNMTSSEELQFENQKVTIHADEGRLYYEGILSDRSLPWTIQINYWLDGEAVTAEDLAGRSGHLQMDLSISQNAECNAAFFENYALQVTMQLDTDLCRNIRAEGATMANVGRKKQLTYTILPGNARRLEVSADVTDFAMEQISLNGVTLAMAIEIDEDKYPELKNGLQQIENTAVQFDDGTIKLLNGVDQIRRGAEELSLHMRELQQGTETAMNGAADLQKGAAELKDGADTLHTGTQDAVKGARDVHNGATELHNNAVKLNEGAGKALEGARELDNGMGEALDGALQIRDGAETMRDKVEEIREEAARLEQMLENMNPAIEIPDNLEEWLEGIRDQIPSGSQIQFDAYMEQLRYYTGQLEQAADDMERLYYGIMELYDGLVVLKEGSEELVQGLAELKDGTAALEQGTLVLQDGTASLYKGIVQLEDGSYALLSGAVDLSDGAIFLADGMVELENGAAKLCDGAVELEEGIVTLQDGMIELQGGTMKFRDKTANLDGRMMDQLREGIDSLFGNGEKVISFVSPQNTNVQSVQFVIRTPAIGEPDSEQEPVQEEQKVGFWQKLLRLFGFEK